MDAESHGMRTGPVQLEMMIQRFRSIAEEMGYALQRTGYTAFVNETADLGVALVTPQGEIFGYPHSIGITMFSNLNFAPLLDSMDQLSDGDIIICNDPYSTGGLSSHLPDISLIMPIFAENKLVCYAFTYVHSTDIGGKVAGSLSPSSYEIFQEGFRIPPTTLYAGGVLNEGFVKILLANCRVPKDNWGDIRAMVSALRVGERRVKELVARFGTDGFSDAMQDALDYSERRARLAIEKIPAGTYTFWDYLDDDVVTEIPIKFCATLTIGGGTIHVDFSGTDPQVRSAFNIYSTGKPHPWLIYKIAFLLLTLEPDIPVNAGLLRPVTVFAPEGSIVNCSPPAAVGLRTTAGIRLQDTICGALALALPDIMPAAGAGYMAPIVMAEPNESRDGVKVNVLEPMVGGTGASSAGDGLNSRDVVDLANLRNSPLEILEGSASALVRAYRLLPDSGGAGRYRGGLGVEFEFEVLAPTCLVTARGQERHRFRPWGLAGGNCASKASVFAKRQGEEEFVDVRKIDSLELAAGDILRVQTPGGGGYGPALERVPQSVLADVLNGLVSLESARRDYGVVICDNAVDETATAALRRRVGEQNTPRPDLFDFGSERDSYEQVWSREVWASYVAILYDLPPGSRSGARSKLWHAVETMRALGRKVEPQDVAMCWERISGAGVTRTPLPKIVEKPTPAASVNS